MKVLVVEDCPLTGEILQERFTVLGQVTLTSTGWQAVDLLEHEHFDLILVDLNLERRLAGFDVIDRACDEGAYVVVLSGLEDAELVSRAYEMGCRDYFVKGSDERTIPQIIEAFRAAQKTLDLEDFTSSAFITQDSYLKSQIALVGDAARSRLPVLLLGPSGTGKTTIARKIHALSGLTGHFVELNCSAVPENLLESEMFGYHKGAFSGATQSKEGYLERANEGALFLDEVATMPLGVQAKLLKALEEGQFTPLGSTTPVRSRFRLISATCSDLSELVSRGEFRKDLYYRIFGHNITLTPLAQRTADIPVLVQAFLARCARRVYIHPDAMAMLVRYPWPGNVRELKKVVEVLASRRSGIVRLEDLPEEIWKQGAVAPTEPPEGSLAHWVAYAKRHGLHDALERFKQDLITAVTEENKGRVNKTLQDLKISTNTFYRATKRQDRPA